MEVPDEDADDAAAPAVAVARLGERWAVADLESERDGDEGGGNDELGMEAAREAGGCEGTAAAAGTALALSSLAWVARSLRVKFPTLISNFFSRFNTLEHITD